MSGDDRQVNVRVEQQLTRRGVDTSKLTVSSHKGDVIIAGALQKRSIREAPMSGSDMKMLDRSLRRVPNLRSIVWNLTNWEKRGNAWVGRLGGGGGGGEGGQAQAEE